jgi:hypothetical protein
MKRPENVFSSENSATKTPGPGMYKAISDFDLGQKQTSKGTMFGKDAKLKQNINGLPGPGYYYIPCSMVHVPEYTKGKFDKTYKFV